METLIFYVAICTASLSSCNEFEPYSWEIQNEEHRIESLQECSNLSNAYDTMKAVKETDCYFVTE